MKRWLPPIVIVVVLLGLWQLAVLHLEVEIVDRGELAEAFHDTSPRAST